MNVKKAVPLKYPDSFQRTHDMLPMNCGINLFLIWSENCFVCYADRATTFATTETKIYIPVVTLSTPDNAKLLQQLEPRLKGITNSNAQININQKYQHRHKTSF